MTDTSRHVTAGTDRHAGGGVALLALQFCVAVGARVFVTSSGAEKLAAARRLGACGGALYTDEVGHGAFRYGV